MAESYLSLLSLNPASADVQQGLRDVNDLHRRIMEAFPRRTSPSAEARALYKVLHRLEFDRAGGRVLLYVQSGTVPDWSRLPDGYLQPEDGLQVKPIGEVYAGLKTGRVLRFRLRANPTRKVDTKSGPNGEKRNGRRVPLLSLEEQVAWLSRKASQHGFELLHVTIAATGSAERVVSRGSGRTFQGIVFEGRLVVRDPAAFRSVLEQGVGPAKAFGFGLLSVGPA